MADIRITVPEQLPVYPMREQVMFPYMVFPLFIQAEEMPLIDEALRGDHLLGLVSCLSRPAVPFRDLSPDRDVCRINQVLPVSRRGVQGGRRRG